MENNRNITAVVITPTIGKPELRTALESVHNQTFKNVLHLVIIDGEKYHLDCDRVLKEFYSKENVKVLTLPFNTGEKQFYGHRIYAAFSFLVDADYVFFLDEDNWFDTNHVASLVELIEDQKLDWAYSLRKVYSQDDIFITNDDCESLGRWQPFSRMPNLVDSSCYAIKRDILVKVAHKLFGRFAADRMFFKYLGDIYPNFNTTSLYTLNYRLNKDRPPFAAFFINGNTFMINKYKNLLPWQAHEKVQRL